METIKENSKYRLVSGIGQYMNSRYEIQEQYKYYENQGMNKKDIIHSIECKPDIIHISVPTSDIQIYSNLGKDKIWVEENLRECEEKFDFQPS